MNFNFPLLRLLAAVTSIHVRHSTRVVGSTTHHTFVTKLVRGRGCWTNRRIYVSFCCHQLFCFVVLSVYRFFIFVKLGCSRCALCDVIDKIIPILA